MNHPRIYDEKWNSVVPLLGVAGSFAPAGLPNPAAKPLDRSTELTTKSGDPAGAE
jgi:hypothetical protein